MNRSSRLFGSLAMRRGFNSILSGENDKEVYWVIERCKKMTAKNRLYYLDNLKVLLIFLVIIHHVGQTYGSTGGAWFYSYPGDRVESLRFLFRFNAAFFMGLFFFISGYFLPASFDRHGARKFITDKLIRFGIPLIFAAFFYHPRY